jgi:hypothetical protein
MPRLATHHIPLNLKMSADRVRLGKALARRHGTTVSALVSEVFGALERLEAAPVRLHPLLERLAGVVPDPGKTRQEVVMEELERKYGSESGR